jgi:hypothetical protein
MSQLNQLLHRLRQRVSDLLHKEQTVENNKPAERYTEEELMARLKFFIGICLSLTLFGIVFVVLYSLIFVTQPLNAISPIDQKFFELIIPIATFLTGTLSGIMLASPGDKEAAKQALTAANKGWDKAPTPVTTAPASTPSFSGGFGSAPAPSGFGTSAPGFGAVPPAFGSAPAPSFGSAPVETNASGKKIVPLAAQPEL